MKKISKVLITILILFFVLFFIAVICVSIFGKKITEDQISGVLKVPVSLERISLSFPLTITLQGLKTGDFFAAEKISLSPQLWGFFAGKIILGKLVVINPLINLEQSSDGKLNLPVLEKKENQPQVILLGLKVENGRLKFSDKKVNPSGYKIIADKINISVSKAELLPSSLKANFDFSLSLLSPSSSGLGGVSGSGWVDFGPKDMDGIFQIKNLEASYFTPYMGNFISSRKILSAKLDFSALLKAQNNDLAANCHFRLSGLVYEKEEVPAEASEVALSKLDLFKSALDLFTDKEGNLDLDFVIKTKLDKPELTPAKLEKVILEAAAKNIARQSPEEIIDKVSNTIGQFKDLGDQLKDIFKKK